jgi:hypothetical protein
MSRTSNKKYTRSPLPEEKPRFYLFPGQGGKAYRRKQAFIVKSSIAVGVVVSLVVGAALYYMSRTR